MSLVQKSSRPKRSKRRSKAGNKIGGGAWRAFVHANASGKKMDATALKLEYDSLSPEDRAVYQAAGQAATAAHRMGLEPFLRKGLLLRQWWQATRPCSVMRSSRGHRLGRQP